MLPAKRQYDEMAETTQPPTIMSMFEGFKQEIDEHHAARERIIKASRDVTALSKKAIFALQRVRTIGAPIPPKIASDVAGKLAQIAELFKTISADTQGLNAYRYQRQVSGGIQEYMEAISFEHYLRTGSLITPAQSSSLILDSLFIPLTTDDYLLGLFDLSGEMMRFAITAIATTGSLPTPLPQPSSVTSTNRSVLTDIRDLQIAFDSLDTQLHEYSYLGRDWEKKMSVMDTSVRKVEKSACELIIRRSEMPEGWVPGFSMDEPMAEAY